MNTLNQEADMGFITDIVSKIANALVMSTEFPAQMDKIKLDLHNLNVDLDRTKERNIELDNALNDTRRQRDEAEQALSQVKNDLSLTTQRLNSAESHANEMTRTVEDLNQALSKAKAERDDYGMKQMEAEERASQAEAKLAKLAEALGLPKPEAKPVATSAPEPALSQSIPHGLPVPEPTQAQPEPAKRVYEGDYNYYEISKGKPEHWDPEQKRYYVEV